ncbi:MAG: glycosyltransferase family 2 protein [Paraclostridium sordellii]
MEKKVSIILPIYNASKYLNECIDSLISQTYKNIEIIAINDGSTDNSVDIIKEYMKKDNRIKLYENQKNKKLIYTLNRGLDLADGDYIARMDSDDICTTERIEKQVRFLEDNKEIALCGCKIQAFGNEDWTWGESYKDIEALNVDLIFANVVAHPTVMIRGEFAKQMNLKYSNEFIDAEDYELWSRISYEGKIANLEEILLYYRVSENSITATKQESMQKSTKKVVRRNLDRFELELTNIEKKVIEQLINEDWESLSKDIYVLKNIISKIIIQNRKKGLYDENYLSMKLEKKLLKSFLYNDKNIFKYILKISIDKKNIVKIIKDRVIKK